MSTNNKISTPKVDTIYKKKEPNQQQSGMPGSTSEPQIHIREFSLEEQSKIEPLLQKKLHHSLISHRPGPGGSKAAYLEGNVVINLANSILGFNGWSFQIKELKIEHKERNATGDYYVVSSCLVRVILKDGTFREDIGFGDIKNKLLGPAIENSKKGAITDGLKRALRLFGNSLGNCLYDKEFVNKKHQTNDFDSDQLIKKSDTYPDLINSRVVKKHMKTPGSINNKTEMPEEYFDDLGGYLDTGNIKKRNIDQVYDNNGSTPSSDSKRTNVSEKTSASTLAPHANLNSAIKKEAEKDGDECASKMKFSTTTTAEENDEDFSSDDSLDIEDLDREIAESKMRKERIVEAEHRKKAEEKEKSLPLEIPNVLEKLPSNFKEEKLLFKSAASLQKINTSKNSTNILDEMTNLSEAQDFNANSESAATSDKPMLLNVSKSIKISSDKFEKVNHFRDLKNRKYIASAHGNQETKS